MQREAGGHKYSNYNWRDASRNQTSFTFLPFWFELLSASRGEVRRGTFGRVGDLPDLVDDGCFVRIRGEVVAVAVAGGIVAAVVDRNFIRSLPTSLGFSKTCTVPVSFACTSAILFFLSSNFITWRRVLAFFRPCCRSFLARFMSRGAVVAMCLICVRSRIMATRLGIA